MPEEKPQSTTPNFNDLELGVLKIWEEGKIFEKSLEKTKNGEPYIFYDGPPFATGLPHYGHILASTIKDAIPRYQAMKGRYVRRRWGWDCHGLPIENIVEQNLKISGKKQIEEIGVDRFNKVCRDNVLKFAEEWGKMVKRMGRWVNFDNSYKTMDTAYMESVWWALKQIWDKGLIYEDRKVLLYCSRCETPISNFEVAMDNSYKDVTEESVYVKFKLLPRQRIVNDLTNDRTYALAWTTTPWTLPGNTSLNVGAGIDYVIIEPTEGETGERYILAKERLSEIQGEYETIAEFKGAKLEGLEYEPLYAGVIPSSRNSEEAVKTFAGKKFIGDPAKTHKIYLADFVTTEDGTGIVHNAAMYGEEDYELARQKNLPRMDMLDHKGHYLVEDNIPPFLRHVFFKDAEKDIIKDLKNRALLLRSAHYTHSYPHCHRCGTPLYYSALPAWFINIQKIKSRLRDLNQEQINWYPAHLKMGRFDKSMESAPDWNISRNRYWATALPFWRCEACNFVGCVGSIAELAQKSTNIQEIYPNFQFPISNFQSNPNFQFPMEELEKLDLHKPYIDQVKLKCEKCAGNMHRVPEVVDCWVESGSMPFAELHYPFENREEFKARFPADFVAEYIGQTRAWFYVMHVVSAVIFDRAPFKNVVTTGNILAEDGSKMSKSKNNYPDPWLLINKYGIDAVRFYLLTTPVMNADDFNFSEKGVGEISRKVNLLFYNIWSFYRMYEKQTAPITQPISSDSHVLDKWVVARLTKAQEEITKHLDGYNTVKAGREMLDFVDELSTWYLRRSRERIKSGGEPARQALNTLAYVLTEISKLLAPFMPFLSDFIFRDLTGKESVHLEDWTETSEHDENLLVQMAALRQIVELGLSLRKEKNLKVRQPLLEFAYYGKELKFDAEMEAILSEELNVKAVKNQELGIVNREQEGWAAKEGADFKVGLNLNITEELKKEGWARELERQVQDLRKKSGMKVGELADLYYNIESLELEGVLLSLFDRKKTFVSQISKSLEVEPDFESQSVVDGGKVWMGIVKI